MTYKEVALYMTKTAADPTMHTIQKGDMFEKLDRKYKLPIGSFQKANPGIDPKKLQVGKSLVVPQAQQPQQSAATTQPVAQPAEPQKAPVSAVGFPNNLHRQEIYNEYAPSDYNMHGAMMQESLNGRALKGDYRGGKPHAHGILQIREVFPSEREKYQKRRAGKSRSNSMVIDDVNDFFRTKYTLADARDPEKAQQIYKLYLARQGYVKHRRTGEMPADSDYWRMWVGGPEGYKNPDTLGYVRSIQEKYKNPKRWNLVPGQIQLGK